MFWFFIINLLNEKFIEQNFHNVKKGVGCEKLNPGKKVKKPSHIKGKTMLGYVVCYCCLI